MRALPSLAVAALITAGCAHAPDAASRDAASSPRHHLLRLPEMFRRMEASKVEYQLNGEAVFNDQDRQAAAKAFWGNSDAAFPVQVTDASGRITVRELQDPSEGPAGALFADAERAFQQHDFAQAERLYAKGLEISPNDYSTLLAWGETALYQQAYPTAIERFTRAIQVNPWVHAAYAYRGEAQLELGKRDAAVLDYARALARRPRWPALLKEIEVRASALHVRLAPDRLLPAVRVANAGHAIKIEFDTQQSAWLGFGVCKALWLGEESHRVEMTGSARHDGTSIEERECLGALLSSYLNGREKRTTPQDPGLDDAVAITKDGMSGELIAYEILSRMDGNVVAKLPPEEVTRLEAYVRKYVLIDAEAAPGPGRSIPTEEPPSGPPSDPKHGTITARR